MRNDLTVFQSEKKSFVERIFGKDFDFQNILRSLFLVLFIILFVSYWSISKGFKSEFFKSSYSFLVLFFLTLVIPFFIAVRIKSQIVFQKKSIIIKSFYKSKKIIENEFIYKHIESVKLVKIKNHYGFQGVVLRINNSNKKQTSIFVFYLNINELTNLQYFIEKTPKLKNKIRKNKLL